MDPLMSQDWVHGLKEQGGIHTTLIRSARVPIDAHGSRSFTLFVVAPRIVLARSY